MNVATTNTPPKLIQAIINGCKFNLSKEQAKLVEKISQSQGSVLEVFKFTTEEIILAVSLPIGCFDLTKLTPAVSVAGNVVRKSLKLEAVSMFYDSSDDVQDKFITAFKCGVVTTPLIVLELNNTIGRIMHCVVEALHCTFIPESNVKAKASLATDILVSIMVEKNVVHPTVLQLVVEELANEQHNTKH